MPQTIRDWVVQLWHYYMMASLPRNMVSVSRTLEHKLLSNPTSSGGRGAVNILAHDWVYWETGKVSFEARRQTIYSLLGPASVAVIVGAVVITLWQRVKYSKRQSVTPELI